MKTQHTPGPWYQREQGSEIEIKSGIYTICMVHNYSGLHETNEANARLIAAAPELLEELIKIKELVNRPDYNSDPEQTLHERQVAIDRMVSRAIAKATGEKEVQA